MVHSSPKRQCCACWFPVSCWYAGPEWLHGWRSKVPVLCHRQGGAGKRGDCGRPCNFTPLHSLTGPVGSTVCLLSSGSTVRAPGGGRTEDIFCLHPLRCFTKIQSQVQQRTVETAVHGNSTLILGAVGYVTKYTLCFILQMYWIYVKFWKMFLLKMLWNMLQMLVCMYLYSYKINSRYMFYSYCIFMDILYITHTVDVPGYIYIIYEPTYGQIWETDIQIQHSSANTAVEE
jgi:hypothetical protein